MMMRVVAPEALDHLSERDPMAVRARRDLRRVHRAMGTRSMLLRAFRSACAGHPQASTLRVLELGAGDGSVMLGVAQALVGEWSDVRLTLLDRQDVVAPTTLDAFKRAGWSAQVCLSDALAWAAANPERQDGGPTAEDRWDLVVVNLFLHHFEGAPLATLLSGIARVADRFIAFEPARSPLALLGSHLIGLTGAGPVTREDAVLSVHAGFRDAEISAAWPGAQGRWQVSERGVGLFSHSFVASRNHLLAGAAART